MIWFCADDYGLNEASSVRILECVRKGALNKVSVFPNLGRVELQPLWEVPNLRVSLHLNLVEGCCMAETEAVGLLADQNGAFRHTFGGLFLQSLLHPKQLEEQLFREIRAQVRFWKQALPQGVPFCIDSHQHTHMIPAVWNALVRVLREERIRPDYIRIPAEPILPYLKAPTAFHPINLVKQWLLKGLWGINRKRGEQFPTACFFGILFSGKMDEKRVQRVLPHYETIAENQQMDLEVLFHPGYLEDEAFGDKHIVFIPFYRSKNRKTEFDAVNKLSERRGL
ncbi:MAG: ChbG/HpnK family deacetylase [Oscillospiraceae bacterium]|nr:ChbG/HpnK family deacetylase [Oscillospiraceae bacterium]